MNGMPITMLNGLGCPDCGGTCGKKPVYGLRGFGAVNDYDTIRIGGGTYTANQLIGKTILANKTTTLYNGASKKSSVYGTVKAGQPIGKVSTYLKASQSPDGIAWLGFDGNYPFYFFVPDENASSSGLKDQGTLTINEEKKAENDAKLKAESPVEYYVNKYGTKLILIGGSIFLVTMIAKTAVKGFIDKKVKSI